MSRQVKTHTFMGKKYNIKFLPPSKMGNDYGTCDNPNTANKTIKIDNSLSGKKLLEILCHESGHAFFYQHDEETVEQFGKDLSDFLWRLGYRNVNELPKQEEN
jgi:hypothetical protein